MFPGGPAADPRQGIDFRVAARASRGNQDHRAPGRRATQDYHDRGQSRPGIGRCAHLLPPGELGHLRMEAI